jgi:branched-chain amino acid transport system permease protein
LFLGVEEILKAFTDNWMAIFGLLIVAIAMLGKAGVVGWCEGLIQNKTVQNDHDAQAQAGESA